MRIPEIWAEVLMKYPKLPSERTCINEKRMMDRLRQAYYEKLLNDTKAETRILHQDGEA
jgi:hypothetical protein